MPKEKCCQQAADVGTIGDDGGEDVKTSAAGAASGEMFEDSSSKDMCDSEGKKSKDGGHGLPNRRSGICQLFG